MTDKQFCSREEYDKKVVVPVRRYLEKQENRQIRCIVTLFGLPLTIGPKALSPDQQQQLDKLSGQKQGIVQQIKAKQFSDEKEEKALNKQLSTVQKQRKRFKQKNDSGASFDSELMLVKKKSYDLNMWTPNPYYLGYKNRKVSISRSDVLMTARLDGPSGTIVKRIIDDSIRAEKDGLKGRAYFDARWKAPGDKKVSGSAYYDRSIHRAADFLEKEKIYQMSSHFRCLKSFLNI